MNDKTRMPILTPQVRGCDVCNREREVYVHSSSVGPMSFASCVECLNVRAEPAFSFHYLYDMVGNQGDGLSDWVESLTTWQNNGYMDWASWLTWRRTEPQKSVMDAQHMQAMNDLSLLPTVTDDMENDDDFSNSIN